VGLAWIDVGFSLLPLLWELGLSLQDRQSLLGVFLIISWSAGVEILKSGILYCKGFRKPSFVQRWIIMSIWHIIKYRGIYCLVFSWAVGLIVHSVLYKVFFNKSFCKYLYYVNNFVKNYCVSYSKKLWSHTTCFSGDGLAALYLLRVLWATSLFHHSIYCINFEILRFDKLMEYFIGFPWSYCTIYSKAVYNRGIWFSEGRLVAMTFISNDFSYS
jgi:hypothetical protein